MLISWARPLLARTAITLRSSESGIPESVFGTGGFEISYNVRIVFNCPVDVACKDRNPQGGGGEGTGCRIGVSPQEVLRIR